MTGITKLLYEYGMPGPIRAKNVAFGSAIVKTKVVHKLCKQGAIHPKKMCAKYVASGSVIVTTKLRNEYVRAYPG